MLTKLCTLKTTTQHIYSPALHHYGHMLCGYRSAYGFNKDADTIMIQKYIDNQQATIKSANNLRYKFQQFIVPRLEPRLEDIQNKLQVDWKHKRLVLNVDPSALIGSKRLYMKNHLQKNIYQGLSDPTSIFHDVNPSIQVTTQQIRFDPEHFLASDPIAKQMTDQIQHLSQQQQQQTIQQALCEAYQKQPQRFGNRLKYEYKVPQQYHKIIQHGMYNFNQIFFCGINQYSFRHLLMRCYTLKQLKQIFMLSLRYAQSQSIRSKTNDKLTLKGNMEQHYSKFARQLIYLNNYKIIKKIENGEILRRIKFVTEYILDQDQYQQQQQKEEEEVKQKTVQGRGRRASASKIRQKNRDGLVVLAHSYTIQSLNDYQVIKNLQQELNKKQSNIINKALNYPPPSQKQQVKQASSQQNDAQKIQKHAILQVMLGDLWSQPYTLNRFPYISQDYHKLNQNDKQHVLKIYYDHVAKYTGAKRTFYQRYINRLENISAEELEQLKVKDQFREAKQNYQKNLDMLSKKQKIKEEMKDKKEQMEKNKYKVEEDTFKDYPGKYEEVIQKSNQEPAIINDKQKQQAAPKPKPVLQKQGATKQNGPIGRKRKGKNPKQPSQQSTVNKQP